LSERDPVLDLPIAERPYASLRGIKRKYSGVLRRGITESLRLLAANGPALQRELGNSSIGWCETLVSKCPGVATDPSALASMGFGLSAVAEAAPETFLSALEALLQGNSVGMQGVLFDETDDALSSGGTFHYFISALELTRATMLAAARIVFICTQ